MRDWVDYGQRVDLRDLGHECRARWHTGFSAGWTSMHIAVGILEDGRWYVHVSGQVHDPARAYESKQAAWIVVRNWMATRDGPWQRVPCYPTVEAEARMRRDTGQ